MFIPGQALSKKTESSSGDLMNETRLKIDLVDALDHIDFLLRLLPGWCRDPDPFMVQPGRTFEYEKVVAGKVRFVEDWSKRVRERWREQP